MLAACYPVSCRKVARTHLRQTEKYASFTICLVFVECEHFLACIRLYMKMPGCLNFNQLSAFRLHFVVPYFTLHYILSIYERLPEEDEVKLWMADRSCWKLV